MDTWPVVQYNGPRYDKMAEMYQERLKNDSWEPPADFPRITVEPGTILDFGYHNGTYSNGTLSKRWGDRKVTAYGQVFCPASDELLHIDNFWCGSGCVTITTYGLSGRVWQQYHGIPIPPWTSG